MTSSIGAKVLVEKYPQVDTIIQEFCVNIEQTALTKMFDIYHYIDLFVQGDNTSKKRR